MKPTKNTKKSLEEIAELFREAKTVAEQLAVMTVAQKHGYTLNQLREQINHAH